MEELKVLVVDDEADFLETIVKRLQRRKINATGVDSGKKALEVLEAENFDVVVLDVLMPGMDGIETLKYIKKRKPFVEVIILTGHASVESGIQGMQHGAFDYVMKPADLEELIHKIQEAFERKSIHEGRS
ncbi:MAG TPA: response regulator [Syntrophobacteraceae bacterium]|nr:response regulator [Syntrophobacteraceae bacterium]HBZ56227.1 response regulator [Syntrophobacteraceae bacterium]